MHIGIDARLYGIGHRGIGRYVEELIAALAENKKDEHRYTLFMLPEGAAHAAAQLPRGRFKIVTTTARWYTLKEQIVMPRLIHASGVSLMHWTNFNVPIFCPVPYVVTIHDLIVLHFPESRATTLAPWKYTLKLKGYRFILRRAVSKARRVIAVSEYTKRDIVKHLKVDREKVDVIYPGVEQLVLGTERFTNTPQFESYLADRFNIRRSYLLYVGSAYPHKNLERLLRCYELLRVKYHRNWQLVLVGKDDYFYNQLRESSQHSSIDEQIKKDIIFTGEVSDKDLDGLYRSAKMLVFPSLYEGFGLPPLEAAARGVPTVVSQTSSIPEVMADAAAYINPKDIGLMAKVIDALGGSHRLQDELRDRGYARSKYFTWRATAYETVRTYNK